MTVSVDIHQILSLLPHRYPFLLVDRVLEYKAYDYLIAVKNVSINEPFFSGHFPGNPVMPGVLILEALAQASGLLSSLSMTPREGYEILHLFAGIDNAKFKRVVLPGDQLRLTVRFLGKKRDFWRTQAQAFVDEHLACSADLMSAAKEVKK